MLHKIWTVKFSLRMYREYMLFCCYIFPTISNCFENYLQFIVWITWNICHNIWVANKILDTLSCCNTVDSDFLMNTDQKVSKEEMNWVWGQCRCLTILQERNRKYRPILIQSYCIVEGSWDQSPLDYMTLHHWQLIYLCN